MTKRGDTMTVKENRKREVIVMTIFAKYNELECGINDNGELFLSDDRSGYNLPDTLENRERILNDFAILAMDKSREVI